MAPIIAIGSSFLVAGNAGATVKAAKNVKPTLTVCKSVSGSFKFSVNGRAFTLHAQCAAITAKAGVNHVTETWAPATYRNIASITVSPSKARVSTSLRTATASVKLAAHGVATVRFVNGKVVTQVVTKTGSRQTGDGYIEVCKWSSDSYVAGSFPFTIVDSAGTTYGPYSVAVGACTGAIEVAAGTATVTEAGESPYYVDQVTANPSIDLGTVNLGAQTAQATVGLGNETTVNFVNDTALNQIKVCKILSNNQGNLAGQEFWFNIAWTFTPPTGAAPISASGNVGVVAIASPGQVCVEPVGLWPTGIPVGSTVWVNEEPFADTSISGVSVMPPQWNAGSTATEAILTVPPVNDGFADAVFTNDPLGVVEVCKDFFPGVYNADNSATFSVNGGPNILVQGGACSAPIYVPAGTATVSESLDPGFYLRQVSTLSASDPFGTRLLTGNTVNPAVVTVPYGDIGNETVVTFYNVPDPTQFKICKQESSADANLSGSTFDFEWSYGDSVGFVDLTIAPVTATNPQGEVCSGLILGPPSVNPDGSTNYITVTELSTDIAAVQVDSILYQGNGSEYSNATSDGPVLVTGGSASEVFTIGAGINVVTFTNGRTPGATT